MINHKLIQILKTFSKDEFSEFEKFADSPFHNGGRNYLLFIKEIKKFYPEFTGKNLTREYIFGKIYKDKVFSESMVHTTISRVLAMAEKYVEYIAFSKKGGGAKYDYIVELLDRNLYSIAQKELQGFSVLTDFSEGITDEVIKWKMDYEILNFQLSLKSNKSQSGLDSAINATEHHIRFNIMRLAYFIHSLTANKLIYNARYDNSIIVDYLGSMNLEILYNSLKENSQKNELNEITLIYVLWILALTRSDNENYFFEMKELVFRNIEKFHHHEKYNLFQALEAICWVKSQEINREKYDMEMYDISRKRFDHKVLSPDNKFMRVIMFRSLLTVFLYKDDWDYINNFIETSIPLLPAEHRDNMYNFTMAQVNFNKKDYGEALKFSSKINFELFAFKLDIRLLQLKIFYELNYYDEAYSLIDAHKHFISNNETVSEYYHEMHTNFLKYYSRILKLKGEGKKPGDDKLIRSIETTNNIPAKQFLVEKVKELDNFN